MTKPDAIMQSQPAGPALGLLRSALALVLPALLSGACGTENRPLEVAESCDGPDKRVVLPGEDRLAALPLLVSKQEMKIGAVLEEAEPQFGLVTSITVGGEGRIYVADTQANRILVFEPDKDFAGELGSEGEGPGEFQGVLRAEHGVGDSLFVFDLRLWRQVVFDSAGRLARTTAFPQQPQFGQMPEVAQDEAGRVHHLGFGQFRESLLEALDGRASGVARGRNELGQWSRGGTNRRNLLTVPSIEVYFAGGIRDAPFHRRPLWDARAKGGLWYGDSGSYRLVAVNSTGDTVCTVVVGEANRPVSEADRKAYLSAADRAEADDELLRTLRQRRAEMPIPEQRPVLRDLVVAEDGRVWVKPAPEEKAFEETGVWHVFGANGEPLYRVRLPPRLWVHEVVDDRVYGTLRDETDVQHVVRYRVNRGE